ncbi:hypothetical protein BPUTEOSOX_950, partial [thiotrophic endosymbiont of Bathymodiolus puteoserpentis (Logatchev)]
SKTMGDRDQKIIHRWNHESQKSTWTTESSNNVGDVLDHLKLGLDDKTALNIPDALTYEEIGKPIDKGSTKVAYTLKNHPDLLFLQLGKSPANRNYIRQLRNEVEWINKFRELGIKTPKYLKVVSMIDKDNQEHHGILVERIHDSFMVKPGWVPLKEERVTHKTLADIQTLLQHFSNNPDLMIADLQMLVGRDGQLYVIDPANPNSPSIQSSFPGSQQFRMKSINGLRRWRDASLNVLKTFNQNKGVHAIFVSKEMLERDPEFEKSLLDKAQKQQDLVVMNYDAEGTTKVLYEPKTNYKIDRIEVMVDKSNHFISETQMKSLIRDNPKVSSDMVFRHALKKDFSNYRSNIIVQNGNSEAAVKAAQSLANKHPESSIIVHFDDNNKLVTSDNEIYTPKGNVRLNFVDHGENFANGENGMDKLTDKVKQIYDTYANENTHFERIALVGCDTTNIKQGLARNFAKTIYDNMPALRTAQITGRGGEVEINENGTKTMKTGGTKTLYSWRDGGIVSTTEGAKTTADNLKNPLGGFDEYSKLLNELIKKKSSTSSKHYDVLRGLKEDLQNAKALEPGILKTKIFEKMANDLDEHLQGRETKYQKQFDRLSVMTRKCAKNTLAYHLENRFNKGGIDIDVRADMLKDIAGLSLRDQLKRIEGAKSEFERLLSQDEINLAKNAAQKAWTEECVRKASKIVSDITKSQRALSAWKKITVVNELEVSPGPRDTHYVVVQLENDPAIVESSVDMTGKHFENSTLIQMDKEGGYQIVHGPKLHKIKADNIKILFSGHGNEGLKTTGRKTANDIANIVATLRGVLPVQSSIDTVAMKGCNPGADFSRDVAMELKARNIETKVSSRLGSSRTESAGRNTVNNRYHLDEGKVVWAYKDGELTQLDPYTDDNYHLVVSVGDDGLLQLNRSIEGLEGKLKIRVMASDFDTTLAALKELGSRLPDGASMAEINIKMGDGSVDWYATHGMFGYSGLVSDLSSRFNANVLVYNPSGPNRGSYAYRYVYGEYTAVDRVAGANEATNGFAFLDAQTLGYVTFSYEKDRSYPVYNFAKKPNIDNIILATIDSDSYSKQELLKQFKDAINLIKGPVSKIGIITENNKISVDDYKAMVSFLSRELHIEVEAYNTYAQTKPWLSINPGDSQVTEDLGARHLGETQPYNDKKLQSWENLTQEQTNKLTTESQKTKPDLANHDHQILFQTESDDNVKDSTLKLAFKHPTKTTIVQMDKDGAYRVVYGTQLKDITGKVKMVAVGYGREAEDGTQTLGGRSADALSTNITTITQTLNTDAVTIKHVSLVGCNLASDNPTDDNTSTYGAEMLRQLKQTGVESISARSEYVAIDPDG